MIKRYIGDGVYIAYDGSNIILTTENGIEITNTIVLEPQVLYEFESFVEELRKRKREEA